MKIREIIAEVANNPYPVEVYQTNPYIVIYKFTTDTGIDYYITMSHATRKNMKGAYLVFSAGKRIKNKLIHAVKRNGISHNVSITGTGDQYRVLASVGEAIRQYIKFYDPQFIYFTAREPSRISLYNLITRRISQYVSGWTRGKVITTPKYTEFTIIKQENTV